MVMKMNKRKLVRYRLFRKVTTIVECGNYFFEKVTTYLKVSSNISFIWSEPHFYTCVFTCWSPGTVFKFSLYHRELKSHWLCLFEVLLCSCVGRRRRSQMLPASGYNAVICKDPFIQKYGYKPVKYPIIETLAGISAEGCLCCLLSQADHTAPSAGRAPQETVWSQAECVQGSGNLFLSLSPHCEIDQRHNGVEHRHNQ